MSDKAHPSPDQQEREQALMGIAAAGFGYLWWGFSVIYYKALMFTSVWEVLSHRPFWTTLLLALLIAYWHKWESVVRIFQHRKLWQGLLLTSLIIGSNWVVFNYAIATERVMETSLGYYINPLLSMLLGVYMLSERLTRLQGVSVALAALAVLVLSVHQGTPPWISLFLAATFAIYGYLRKVMQVEPLEGLFVETLFMCPVAIAGLVWFGSQGDLYFLSEQASWGQLVLIVAIGPMTAVPLFAFNYGARRIPLSTIGLMQYIVPTTHFLLALFYGEPFSTVHFLAFALIWTALGLYTVEIFRLDRQRMRSA